MPTKTDDDAAFWDALYEKELPPSTWDDHRELDEAPGDNFALNGADKDAGARLQIAGLDQRYQAAIDNVVAKLTAIEADTTLTQPAAREALIWLGENAAFLGYFLGGTAATLIRNDPANPASCHRGMYQPPQASNEAEAARGLLHSKLMALIADEAIGVALGDYPELQKAINRIAWIVRAGYIDHLGRQFAETKNPAYAWHAIRLVLTHNLAFPAWLSAYLGKCADNIYNEGKKEPSDKKQCAPPISHALISEIFGFTNPINLNKFYGQLSAVRADWKKVSVYTEVKSLRDKHIKMDVIKSDVCDKEGVSESTAANYSRHISKRMRTGAPYSQDT